MKFFCASRSHYPLELIHQQIKIAQTTDNKYYFMNEFKFNMITASYFSLFNKSKFFPRKFSVNIHRFLHIFNEKEKLPSILIVVYSVHTMLKQPNTFHSFLGSKSHWKMSILLMNRSKAKTAPVISEIISTMEI